MNLKQIKDATVSNTVTLTYPESLEDSAFEDDLFKVIWKFSNDVDGDNEGGLSTSYIHVDSEQKADDLRSSLKLVIRSHETKSDIDPSEIYIK